MSSENEVVAETKMVQISKMKQYRERRFEMYDTWFEQEGNHKLNADQNGPILDFAIVGKYRYCRSCTVASKKLIFLCCSVSCMYD